MPAWNRNSRHNGQVRFLVCLDALSLFMGGGSKLCHNAHIDGTDGVQAVPVNAAIDPSTVAQDKDIYVTCDSWCVCSPGAYLRRLRICLPNH